MGLTKQYLRFAPHNVFNVIGSGRGGGVYLREGVFAVAAVGSVEVWDLRTREKLVTLRAADGPRGPRKLEVLASLLYGLGRFCWCPASYGC